MEYKGQAKDPLFIPDGKKKIVAARIVVNHFYPVNHPVFLVKPEPLEVLSITLENLEKVFEFGPKFERLGRLFATQEYLKKAAYDYHRVRVTTRERFIEFLRDNSDLLQRVPQKYLASYLDMKPETFCRMKHFTKGRL